MLLDYLPLLFFLIALLYSFVGFGGGSSYLAVLSLVIADFYEIRSTALILNICVVSIGVTMAKKYQFLQLKKFWPFFILSIPLAYLGAQIKLSEKTFFIILGATLIMASLSMFIRYLRSQSESRTFSNSKKIILGGGIGLLSGISGIGGGIFLSPTLNLLRWESTRVVAALASLFILVNSISGLFGLWVGDTFQLNIKFTAQLIIAVVLGGALGSFLSYKKLRLQMLGILTAVLVFYVGVKLVLLNGFGISI